MIEAILFLGIMVAFSMIILLHKIKQRKWSSLFADGLITFFLMFLFAGSFIGLSTATIAGILLSIYFYFYEPKFNFFKDDDKKNKNIFEDIKITKQYTIEKVIKDLNHQYRWQLSVYKYLVEQEFDDIFSTKLLLVLKDGGYNFRKNAIEPSIELLEIEPIDGNKVEEKFFEIVDAIERYETLGEEPPMCSDLWWRKTKSGSIPVRCEQYCAYKDVCKYYKQLKGNPLKAKNLDI